MSFGRAKTKPRQAAGAWRSKYFIRELLLRRLLLLVSALLAHVLALTSSLAAAHVFPALLHEDPRYFRRGTGGFWYRTGYAVSRVVVTHKDGGGTRFNFSEWMGNASAVAISSVMPSEKNSCSLSSERLAKGSTAIAMAPRGLDGELGAVAPRSSLAVEAVVVPTTGCAKV